MLVLAIGMLNDVPISQEVAIGTVEEFGAKFGIGKIFLARRLAELERGGQSICHPDQDSSGAEKKSLLFAWVELLRLDKRRRHEDGREEQR